VRFDNTQTEEEEIDRKFNFLTREFDVLRGAFNEATYIIYAGVVISVGGALLNIVIKETLLPFSIGIIGLSVVIGAFLRQVHIIKEQKNILRRINLVVRGEDAT